MKKVGSSDHAGAWPCPHCLAGLLRDEDQERVPQTDDVERDEESSEFRTTPEMIAGVVMHEIVQNIMTDDNPENKCDEVRRHLSDYSRIAGFSNDFTLSFHEFSDEGKQCRETRIVQEYIVNQSRRYDSPRSAKQAEQLVRNRGIRFIYVLEELIDGLDSFNAEAETYVSSAELKLISSLDGDNFTVNGFIDLLIIENEKKVRVIEIKTGNPANLASWKRQAANYVECISIKYDGYEIVGDIMHAGDEVNPAAALVPIGVVSNRWHLTASLSTPDVCEK